MSGKVCLIALVALVLVGPAGVKAVAFSQDSAAAAAIPAARGAYTLGPGDQVVVRALDLDEISEKPMRIGADGQITLPLIGPVSVSGKTVSECESQIAASLKRYLRNPSVSIQVTEFRSQPVSVLGSVKNPGIVQLEGRKTLVEVLSLAGGTLDDAGSSVRLTRRKEWGPVDLPGAKPDATGDFTVAEVSLKSVLENRTPAANIVIRPFDVISVPRADIIYVIGQVRKPGGFTLREREVVSVLHALAMAEGLDRMAAPKNSKILRATRTGSPRQEIALNLSKVMEGKAQDPVLQPDDILFIPVNQARSAALRSVEAAIQTVTGMVIWRR